MYLMGCYQKWNWQQKHVVFFKAIYEIFLYSVCMLCVSIDVFVIYESDFTWIVLYSLGRTSGKLSPFPPLCRAYRRVRLATHMRTLYFRRFSSLRDIIWRQPGQVNQVSLIVSFFFSPIIVHQLFLIRIHLFHSISTSMRDHFDIDSISSLLFLVIVVWWLHLIQHYISSA